MEEGEGRVGGRGRAGLTPSIYKIEPNTFTLYVVPSIDLRTRQSERLVETLAAGLLAVAVRFG